MGKKYKMSSAQKRLFALYEIDKNSIAYNIPSLYKIEGEINIVKLNDAVIQLVNRHEILRTHFSHYKDNFVQEIEESAVFKVGYQETNEVEIKELMEDFIQPFDLEKLPLMRMKIIRNTQNGECFLLFDIHHIICDGESVGIFFSELDKIYRGAKLPELKFQYKNFSAWEQKQTFQEQEEYWLNEFSGDLNCLELRTDYVRPAWQSFKGHSLEFSVERDTVERIRTFCSQMHVTEFMLFMSVFSILLQKYTGQEDIVIGSPMLGRTLPDSQNLIGMFVNTVAIRNDINKNYTFKEVLMHTAEKCILAYDNQNYQFDDLVRKLSAHKDNSRNPLFDVMFGVQNGGTCIVKIGNANLVPTKIEGNVSKFDITLMIDSEEDGYILYWEYNSDIFRGSTIRRMAEHYITLLNNAIDHYAETIDDIEYISKVECNELIHMFENEDKELYSDKILITEFEKCVEKYPNNIALEYQDKTLTYCELNQLANNIAAALKKEGAEQKSIIALWADTSFERIAAVLGILKIGSAYMPIDIAAPIERVRYMIKNAGVRFVIQDAGISKIFAEEAVTLHLQEIVTYKGAIVHEKYEADIPAYVIYTSGSTGNPKGVVVNNRNIVNEIFWHIKEAELNENTIFVQNTAFIFDGSVIEIFSALLCGGRLRLVSDTDRKEPEMFLKRIKDANIYILPSMFRAVMDYAITNGLEKELNSYHRLGLVAEKIPEDLIERYLQIDGSNLKNVWNLYGPTETTITASFYYLNENMDYKHIPIGRPITNYNIFILNGNSLCGHGVVGEICISGVGVSEGYINNKEMTEKVFVDNPFGSGVMYRTGDTGYINENNEIVILGRIDEQVKIRGFRVELQEIEKQIMRLNGVDEAVVIRKKDSNGDFLAGYYTGTLRESDLRDAISGFLPTYMIPEYLIPIKSLPHLPNGKIDKKDLESRLIRHHRNSTKPITAAEKIICGIYEEVLEIDEVGRDDSFFELGGDSIKAIRIVSKLRNIGYQITVKSIMQLAKPVLIAKELQKMKMTDVEVQKATGEVLLSPIQYRFFEAKLENPDHFNQSVILTTNEQINLSAIKYSMKCILENHDQLRAVFDGKHQEIRDQFDEGQYALYLFNLKDSNLEDSLRKVGNELQKHISLSKKKLICCAVIESRDFHALMICIHHLVIDGISWSILIEDINELYAGYMRNKTVNIPKRTTSFKEWSETLSNYYQKGRNNEELLYWRKISKRLGNSKPLFSEVSISTLREVQFRLSEEITSKLVKLGQEIISMNPNEVLLTVLIRVLTILFNRKDISILIESHGRPELCEQIDITRTVGWFTALYPVLFEKIGDDYFDDLLIIKERLRSIPNNGVGYDVARMNKLLDPDYHEPLITYNYFGNREAENGIDSYTLRPSNYEIGNNIDIRNHFGSPLSVNAEIIKGKYCVDISYPISMITEKEYLAFKNMFLEQAEKYVIALEARKERVTTPSDYYQNDISLQDWSIITRKLTMFDEKLEDIYCLTPLQEGMLYDKLRNVDSLNYVLQTVIKLRKPIDLSIMEDAIERLSEAHSILKTHIFYDGIAKPKQVVPITRKIGLEYIDLTDKQGKNDLFEDICNNQRNRGFDFERDSLIRFVVCRLSDKDNKIIITAHHVIMDGWSFPIIVNDLMKLYENRDLRLNRPRYAEYINYMKNKDNSCVYWKELLQGVEEKTAIIPLKKDISFENDILEVEMSICESDVKKIEKLARKYHVTTNTFVETVWGILLQQYNGIDDAIFGKVVSGRNIDIPEIEKMVGLFINTIPVRVKSERDIKFIDLLKRIQNQSVESSEHDHISLMKIQEEAGIGENSVQTVLAFENYYVDNASMDYGYEVENSKEQTDFDLALAVSQDKRLRFNLMYRVGKYSTIEMDYLLEHLKNLIQDVLSDPEKKVSELCVVSQQEKTDIMTLFNRPINDFSKDTVIDRFVKIVERFPEKIAVESEVDRLTYHELNQRSNYIAMKLIDLGVKQNDIVAILMERSCEMLVAIVSVLKAGAAYLPIAPNQPNDRIHYMLTDSEVKTVIVDHMRQNVTALDEQYIIDLSKQTDVMDNNIHLDIMPENLAYTIYTSGTTGKPKGVLIEHRNLINLVDWLAKELQLNEESKVIQNFAFIFDGSVWEIFPTILSGSCLRIVSDEEKMNPEKMISVFSGAHLTIIPSMYRELLNYAKKNGKLSQLHSLKTLLLGAEELPKDLVDDFFVTGRECKNIPRLINAYGPTETTVCCTYYELDKDGNHVPYIGKSINNTQAYIVQNGHLAGIGMVGEVCISGNGVARGYLKREELNREKFVYYPFKENVRMYRTGDLGRWNIDGNIELLGRIGEQVKIRGFRIELEEIAQTLRKYPKIEDAAVIYDKYESGKLIAYCVTAAPLDITDLRNSLSNYLNAYMVPDEIICIDSIPRTLNGKIDRRALPKINSKRESIKVPQTLEEKVLYEVLEETLGFSEFSIDDNFFVIGGNSLKAISVMTNLKNKGYSISVRDIIKYRTVEMIALHMKKENVHGTEIVKKSLNERRKDKFGSISTSSNYEVEFEYAATELQKFYLNSKTFIQEIVEVSCGEEKLLNVLNNIVKAQSVLRSVATRKSDWIISEIKHMHDMKSAIIDVEYEKVNTMICQLVAEYRKRLGNDRFPLTEIHILRESKIKFTILLLAHHCIWDKSSSLIFNELIEDSLSLENYMPDNGRYSDYVMKINQTDKKLFNMYDEWPLKRVVKSQNVRLSISNGKEKEFLANPWKIVEEIIYSIGKSNGLLMDNKLLLYVVQDDRTYFEKDTAMLIGQCLDLMPVEMDMEKIGSLEESIKCLQSKKALYNLNYISLSSMNADRIREMFSSVLILNFQGQYEMDEKLAEVWLLEAEKAVPSTEIFIGRCKNALLLSYPIFDNCTSDIESTLIKICK